MSFAKKVSKSLSGKYSEKLLNHTKRSATDAFKTVSKRAIPKAAEGTVVLIDNKIADGTTKVSKSSPQNNLEKVTNEYDKEIRKERYMFPEERQNY